MNHSPHLVLVLLVAFAFACSRPAESSKTEQPIVANNVPPSSAVTPAVAPSPAVAALKVTQNSDGTIRVQFTDRWGNPSDATYESLQFLERAAPSVSRGMTDAQAPELTQQINALAKVAR